MRDAAERTVVVPLLTPAAAQGEEVRARARGYARGYAEGLRAAEAEGAAIRAEAERAAFTAAERARTEWDAATRTLATEAAALRARTAPILDAADATLLETALLIAEAVIGAELDQRPDAPSLAVTRAIEGIEPASVVRVRLHPDDLARLGAGATGAITAILDRLVADARLAPGDAVVDLEEAVIDARISTALARARAALAAEAP